MPNDQVTIDPEFQPLPPRFGQSRWLRFGALAAAAFLLGWLLRSPSSGEADTPNASGWTIATIPDATSTTRPSATTSGATVSAMAGLEVPLNEAVPGFADAITMVVTGGEWGEEVEIVRWLPSQVDPETIVSFREESPDAWEEEVVGLDAAGTWYAAKDVHDVLSVRLVAQFPSDEWRWGPYREVVGLRVVGAVWHDTAPGRLAWLSCPRMPGGPGTLYTLDVADSAADPMAVTRSPDACGEMPMWINQWGDWGFALEWGEAAGWEEPTTRTVLLDPSGAELAQFESNPGGVNMVAAGPGGTVWTGGFMGGTSSSFLLSLDGQRRIPVPGLAEEEWVEHARWSPDGSLVALVVHSPQTARALIRIVDAATGETTAEIDHVGPIIFQTCWSSDGRYLLVGHDRDEYGAAGATLMVYDTATAELVIEEPFRELHDLREIRTLDPASIAVQFTPVDWGISPDEMRGPGVYTVRMTAEARFLLPEGIEDLSGRLIWNETAVELCNIGIDAVVGGFVQIGDIFQTIEGCGANPDAMQDAFDQFGLPESACLVITAGDVDHEYCAPLS